MASDNSEATAKGILELYVASVRDRFGPSVQAVILVGSLVTGSYVPGAGDIDQITIVQDELGREILMDLLSCVEDAMNTFDRAVHLASVIYERSNLERPWLTQWDLDPSTRHKACVPEELLRIHDHGTLLYGSDFSIAALPRPTRAEMVRYHERWREWNRICSANADGGQSPLSLRLQVQTILSRAIWHYYYATGRTCFNKHTIAMRLATEVPTYGFRDLVEQATQVRMSGFNAISRETLETIQRGCDNLLEWSQSHSVQSVPE